MTLSLILLILLAYKGVRSKGIPHSNRTKQLQTFGYKVWERLLRAHDYGAAIDQYFCVTWAVPVQDPDVELPEPTKLP
eukprot:2489623-Ditylum_brightwellii.AAC.1